MKRSGGRKGGKAEGRKTALASLLVCALLGCRGTLSPLSNKLKVGQESYIVFVADGEDGKGDLFASPADGGKTFQVTFTRVDERAPALSPDGALLAFLRSRSAGDSSYSLVVMNLLNGAERRTDAPDGATAVSWSGDGSFVYLRAGSSLLTTPAPPGALSLKPVAQPQFAGADSSFQVIFGDPPLGQASPCDSGGGVCARLATGESLTLSTEASNPVRWSSDSVAYMEGGTFVVRPLAGGRTRTIRWSTDPKNPRGLTYFRGVSGDR